MPKAKKRALSSSSDSSGFEAAGGENVVEKTKKKKAKTTTSSSDEQAKAKKAKKDKKEQPEKPKEIPKEAPKEAPSVKEPEKKKPDKVELVVHKTTTVKDMLRLKRDKMRKIEQVKTSSGTTTATDDEGAESESVSSLAVSESSRDSHPDTAAPSSNAVNGVKEISLPENLPTDIASLIASLKQHIESTASSKSNAIDTQILDQLVTIDNGAKSVSSAVRVQTFNYLEQFMPITKKTLFTKVRKHRVEQVEKKVKTQVNKLRKIVVETMPSVISKYELDLKNYESRKSILNVVGDMSSEANVPRKKFYWNEASRLVLADIHLILQDLYKIAKLKKETVDEFLARKFREDIVPLWPEGWIKPEDLKRELDRKKKKEAKARSAAAAPSLVQAKPNTAAATNGKAPHHAQKTENPVKKSDAEVPLVNGNSPSQKSSLVPVSSSSPASVIKRSSDHSINSIISSSPSPPTTSHSAKAFEALPPRVIDLEKLSSPNDLLKVVQPKSTLPKFNASPGLPVDIKPPEKEVLEKVRRSDSSDSDCVEFVGEFSPIMPAKSLYNHNNNNKVNLPPSHPAPVAKKTKKHGSDEGEHETDYSKIIMGIQSLTVRQRFSYLLFGAVHQ